MAFPSATSRRIRSLVARASNVKPAGPEFQLNSSEIPKKSQDGELMQMTNVE